MIRASRCAVLLAGVLCACGPAVATTASDDSTGTGVAQTTSGVPGTTDPPLPQTSTSSSGTTDPTSSTGGDVTTEGGDGTSSSTSSVSSGFITLPDGGTFDLECSVWASDCPRGQECKPWVNDGGETWNATRCVPLPDDPDLVGESCTSRSGPATGVDTCEARSMCFGVDPDTLEGTCVAYCGGDEMNPVCTDPDTTCVVGNDGVIAVCLPSCDPLLQDCGNGELCVRNHGTYAGFFCMPPGTPYLNDDAVTPAACTVGEVGVLPDLIDGCPDEGPCCASFCDLAEGGEACGASLACAPWVPEGTCPGECNEGICLTPA